MAAKTALVTGANKGIGFEIARQLAKKGFHIILAGRDNDRVGKAVQQLLGDQLEAEGLIMDIADIESIKSAFDQLSGRLKNLDILVNNAGILLDESTPLLQIGPSDFLQTFQTNAFGAFFTVQALLPLLNNGSRVINVSSSGGQILNGVNTWAPVYSMSKTTLNVITMQLAQALKGRKVTVNAICPGWVRSDMGGMVAPRSAAKGAETAVWLATEAGNNITGKFFRDKQEISW